MTNITLDYLIANNSRLLPHIEERAVRISHQQTVMLQNSLQLPIIPGWAERATSAYSGISSAMELSENTDIPKANMYRARIASSKPKEWGLAYELTDRRISSDSENVVADVINALGVGLRRRIEASFFSAAATSFANKYNENRNFLSSRISFDTLLRLATEANHISPSAGDILFVAHPYQLFGMYQDLIAMGTNANTMTQQGQAALSNLTQMPNLSNVALAIPNIGLVTISHNMPRRLQVNLRIHGAAGTFRLSVGDKTTGDITVASLTAAGIKTALDALAIGTWTITGTNTGTGFVINYPPDLFLPDYAQIRPATDTSTADNVTLDSNIPVGYIQKSKYDKVSGTDPYSTGAPKDINGEDLGFVLQEANGVARLLAYRRNALAFDARTAPKLTAELLKDERVIRYAYYQTFNATGWDVRNGFSWVALAASV